MPTNRIIAAGSSPAVAGLQPYGEFVVATGDADIYGIDWNAWLANYWSVGSIVAPSSVIRPHAPNGYQFSSVLGGESGNTEPVWPFTLGQTVNDGSVVWICAAVDTTSLTATVQSAAWSVPTGITVSGQAVSGQVTTAVLNASGAAVGQNYTINVVATLSDGETKTGRIVLKVR